MNYTAKVLTGDWIKLSRALTTMNTQLKPQAIALLYETGDMVLERLNYHIESQDLNWKPKKVIRHSPLLWVETGELKDSMQAMRISEGGKLGVFVGFLDTVPHYSGHSAAQLALMLEEGINVPSRPLVKPTWDEMRDKLVNEWKEWLIKFVKGL